MGQPEWVPANAVEQAMASALASGDGPEFARLLRTTRLLVPELPAPGTPEEAQLVDRVPGGGPYVPVFTSEEALEWAFGDLVRHYHEIDLSALLQRWPDPDHQLAVNVGSPIATFLPPRALDDVAAGRQPIARAEQVEEVLRDEALNQIRRLVLRELGSEEASHTGDAAPLRADPSANPTETALLTAVEEGDAEAYLHALLASDGVILPTGSPVSDPDDIFSEEFPWRVLGGDQAQVIPVFSSREMLHRTGAGTAPHLEVDFLLVLASWPSEDHLLCVNPGSVMELMLPGETVLEVVAAMAEEIERTG